MKIFKSITLLLLFYLNASFSMLAQGEINDYLRAFKLQQKYANKVYYSHITPHWVNNTHSFWYGMQTPEGFVYMIVDADKREKKLLLNAEYLAKELTIKTNSSAIDAKKLKLQNLSLSSSLDTLYFEYHNAKWLYSVQHNSLINKGVLQASPKYPHWMVVDDEKKGNPVVSPDKKYTAYIKDCNLFIRDNTSRKETQLSYDGNPSNYYSTYIKWSPDSKRLVSSQIRSVEKRYVYYLESSPKEQWTPILHKQEYAKPGDELLSRIPCVFEVQNKKQLTPSTSLFSQQYSLHNIQWNKDSKSLTFEYNQRGHQVYRILELNAETGNVRPIIEETSNTFVNYSRQFRYNLKNENKIIWMSERDNYNHLYLYDVASGKMIRQITKGQWYVRKVVSVDEQNKQIYFTASGMVDHEDPYLIRYYKIDFDGSNLVCFTPEEGNHTGAFSSDRKYFVDVFSLINKAPQVKLVDCKSAQYIMDIEQADISLLLKEGWIAPEPFVAKGRDGKTDIWGIVVRPSDFDSNKKYPIIEYIYAGPGNHYVPKSFVGFDANMYALAELGFIVVQIDGMGTSFRSKSFEDICYKNLKDAGFPDRKLWLQALANQYSYVDIDRVGIFGASAGGQEAVAAALFHGDFYKAAYSACGCHDNRMDKIWWNEQWMGYPIDQAYSESSNVDNAHLLQGALMLVVGELDDNVDPASTMKVADALIKAHKDFDLIVLPGQGHTMGGNFGEHKRFDFFVKNLLNKLPPKWSEVTL